jgi:hypothetical protein
LTTIRVGRGGAAIITANVRAGPLAPWLRAASRPKSPGASSGSSQVGNPLSLDLHGGLRRKAPTELQRRPRPRPTSAAASSAWARALSRPIGTPQLGANYNELRLTLLF